MCETSCEGGVTGTGGGVWIGVAAAAFGPPSGSSLVFFFPLSFERLRAKPLEGVRARRSGNVTERTWSTAPPVHVKFFHNRSYTSDGISIKA